MPNPAQDPSRTPQDDHPKGLAPPGLWQFDLHPAASFAMSPDGKWVTLLEKPLPYRVQVTAAQNLRPAGGDPGLAAEAEAEVMEVCVTGTRRRRLGPGRLWVEDSALIGGIGEDAAPIMLDRVLLEERVLGYRASHPLEPGATYRHRAGAALGHGGPVIGNALARGWRMREQGAAMGSGLASGTIVMTGDGPVPIDWLGPGDLVATVDHGLQPLRGACHVVAQTVAPGTSDAVGPGSGPDTTSADCADPAGGAPGLNDLIVIEPGALGPGLPQTRLRLAPEQMLALSGAGPELLFGSAEVLARAGDLARLSGIHRAVTPPDTGLYHLLFDRPELIVSAGMRLASLCLSPTQTRDLISPHLSDYLARRHGQAPRPVLAPWEAALLVETGVGAAQVAGRRASAGRRQSAA